MSSNRTSAEIDVEIVKVSVFSIPGPILMALGLLGKFGEPDEIPFQFLNDVNIVNVMLIVGVAITVWSSVVVIRLAKEKAKIRSEAGS